MTAKRLEIFIIIIIIGVAGIVYAFTQKPVQAPAIKNNQITQVPGNIITYQGQDGKNALELLEAAHRVDVKHYSFGDMVIGIDGIAPDANHFWAMYVNNQFSQVGASQYATKSSDTIKWEIDAVANNK